MGHNINNAERGVDASVFTVREPAWHGLGTVFAETPSIDQALEKMGGNYQVTKVPCEYKGVEVPGHYWTIRTDTDVVLGEVGEVYRVIQTADAMKILEDIGGEIQLVSGGVLGQGERIFICCKLPSTTKIAGDLINHYFVLVNGHDGGSSLILCITPVRTVCQNTVNAGIAAAARRTNVRHTVNYEARLGEAARILGIVKNYYTKFETIANDLLARKSSHAEYVKMIDTLIGVPTNDDSKRKKAMYERQRGLLLAAYDVPDLSNVRGTAWGDYNAVVDYSDHARIVRGKDEARAAANKFLRTFIDNDLKDRALELILAR